MPAETNQRAYMKYNFEHKKETYDFLVIGL